MKIGFKFRRFAFIETMLIIFLVFGLFPIRTAEAQASPQTQTGQVQIDSVRVDIWPEYDKPASALIIYNVTISPLVTLPVDMTLRIPKAAGKPYAMAWQSADKALYDLKYETSISGDWIQVKFTSPAQEIRLEYYDPSIKKTGTTRNFTFQWPADYTVNNLSLMIQQPVKATNITFLPDAGSGKPGDDGMTYFTKQVGNVKAGTTFDLQMTYDKPDDTLTNPNQFQAAQPAQPVNSNTSGRVTFDQLLPWLLGSLGILLIAGGFLWYWRSGLTKQSGSARRPRHARAAAAVAGNTINSSSAANNETVFCNQCGKRAGPGDAFCRACGTKLR